MPVHIGQMTTDVIADSSAGSVARDATVAPVSWKEEARGREIRAEIERVQQRTRAHGYDD